MSEGSSNPNYRWLVLFVVMIGTLMAALDSSIVNVSIPSIMADFGSGVDDIEWVITGYMLSFATLMPLTAWLRDRIGHKNLYIAALILFTVGSLLCGMAWNLPSLIVARVIQALGGGAITPTGMAMISDVFPPRERGKAIGYWGLGVILGPAFGPTLGGFLTKAFGWRSIFLVNIPIGIIGVLLSMRILMADTPHPSKRRPFDFWGFAFLSAFLVSFLLGLSKGEHEGWTSAYLVTCAAVAFFGLVGFLVVELQVDNPIMDLNLLKIRTFSVCMIVTVVRSIALFGGTFLLPLFLQQMMGFDAVQSGLIMLPGALIIAPFMPLSGKLSERTGPRILTVVGLSAVAVFMFMYRNLDINLSVWGVIRPTMIRGMGIGLLMAPVTAAAMNSVPNHKSGMASSMLNLIQQVGGSLGVAVLGTILSHRIRFHLSLVGASAQMDSAAFQESARKMFYRAVMAGHGHAEARLIALRQVAGKLGEAAQVLSFQDAFLIGAVIVGISIIPAMMLPGATVHADPNAEPVVLE